MYEKPCPTGERNKAINPYELGLPSSQTPEQTNNHHMYWEFNKLGRFLIPKTFRDIQHNQVLLPRDMHANLHQKYGPPPLPTLADMVEEIEIAYAMHEPLQVQENRKGPYFHHLISFVAMKQIYLEYNDIAA